MSKVDQRAGLLSDLKIETIVAEHAEEASFLWLQRVDAVRAPNYNPQQFADLDERLEAHVDGLRVAGDEGWRLAEEGLDAEEPENFFPASVLAIEAGDGRFEAILKRAQELPGVVPGIVSALGWVEPKFLSGLVKSLLSGSSSFHQMLGLAACDLHRKDPGATLDRSLTSEAHAVRSRALRAAGDLGRVDLMPVVVSALADAKYEARYWAARSGVLLGNRGRALDLLASLALGAGPRRVPALQLALQAMPMESGHDLLQRVVSGAEPERLRIIGAGIIGSVRYVPWLIDRMADPMLARVAGEAFVGITGADFDVDQLEAMPPQEFEDGPTDDPADENVEVPEDVALPWPDVARIKSWWDRTAPRFDAHTRYFLGVPVSTDSCRAVLKAGFQRQRVLAAQYVSLLNPGTLLFTTSAPAWRQQRLLAEMA